MKFAVVLFVFTVLLGLTKGDGEQCETDTQCNMLGCSYCDSKFRTCQGCVGECNSDDFCHGKYKNVKSSCGCFYQRCSYGCTETLLIAPAPSSAGPGQARPHMVGHGRN